MAMKPLLALNALTSLTGSSCDSVDVGYRCAPEMSHSWGQYSPYFTVPSDISADVPPECQVTFVNVLSRHGARYPTSHKTPNYQSLIKHIHDHTKSYGEGYEFIQDYEYNLESDILTPFGESELFNSGIKFYKRYAALTNLFTPFFRTSSLPRVVASAQKFAEGFHSARGLPDPTYPYPMIVLTEGLNDTLSPKTCANYEEGPNHKIGENAVKIWRDTWIEPVQDRVNQNLQGAKLNKTQVVELMDMCPFNTVGNDINGTISPFCYLFCKNEWTSYNYYQTLGKWYDDMYGNPLGPTQGVGFVTELIARMTQNRSYVSSPTSYNSINHTLDDDQSTFPLGAEFPLYADFSHDEDLATIFSAMGLYQNPEQLSNTTLQTDTNGYTAAWVVPFSARAYFEKMKCAGQNEELVRVVINDRIVPLDLCGADKTTGMCTLGEFVAAQDFALAGGLWNQCGPSESGTGSK